jgi:hypothetical protein
MIISRLDFRDAQPIATYIGTTNVVDDAENDFDAYVETIATNSISNVKYELDHYLKDSIIPDFDILNWWEVSGVVYPRLQAIAKVVLVIPISIVAFESASNTSVKY